MIKINNCLKQESILKTALIISNKIAFDKGKGFVKSWDNKTYWEFATNLDREINKINVYNYHFEPYLQKTKRTKKRERKIYISTWRDKLVETWINRTLSRSLKNWYSKKSYAYNSDIGINQCQKDISKIIKNNNYIIRRDITNYFYTINHDILLKQVRNLVDEELYNLISQRINYKYYDNNVIKTAEIGIPFGSPIACVLSNIYLTTIDKEFEHLNYFRYADDFLIIGNENIADASEKFKNSIESLGLKLSPRKSLNLTFGKHKDFETINSFKFLGLEYCKNGIIRLPIEKRRKIINIFKRTLSTISNKCNKLDNIDTKLELIIKEINNIIELRIRYVAIIDYYLKHITDEEQLKSMDREIAENVISTILNKKFRKRDFKKIPFKKLRDFGLISLLHRNRLHKQGHISIPFMSLFNNIMIRKHEKTLERKLSRISQIKLSRKLN